MPDSRRRLLRVAKGRGQDEDAPPHSDETGSPLRVRRPGGMVAGS
jgi:hypothetical protein